MPAITIILPISREQHLLKVLASLELLECERDRTSLLAFDDGDADLFLTARNLVEQSKLAGRLCVLSGSTPRSYVVLSTATSARHARWAGKRSTSRKPSCAVDLKAVRAWTTSNGIQLSSLGRLPASVLEQYRSAGN